MIVHPSYYEAVGIGAVVNGAVFFGIGYLYGSIAQTDQVMMAQAMAIYGIANTLLNAAVDLSTGGKDQAPLVHLCSLLVGECGLGVIQILALKHLQLIAGWGTAALAAGLYAKALYRLSDWSDHFESV